MQWETFVRNRIKEIREFSRQEEWKYVPEDLNLADLPSRGWSPAQLVRSEWWLGPSWLYKPDIDWPKGKGDFVEEEINREIKKSALVYTISTETTTFKVDDYFLSYNKLIRFLAWMHRFLLNWKKEIDKRKKLNDDLDMHELPKRAYLSGKEQKRLYLILVEKKAAETRLFKYLQDKCLRL